MRCVFLWRAIIFVSSFSIYSFMGFISSFSGGMGRICAVFLSLWLFASVSGVQLSRVDWALMACSTVQYD